MLIPSSSVFPSSSSITSTPSPSSHTSSSLPPLDNPLTQLPWVAVTSDQPALTSTAACSCAIVPSNPRITSPSTCRSTSTPSLSALLQLYDSSPTRNDSPNSNHSTRKSSSVPTASTRRASTPAHLRSKVRYLLAFQLLASSAHLSPPGGQAC
jgi:hypothetical protein